MAPGEGRGAQGGGAAGVPVRGTQSFVQVLSQTWRRPGLTALEVGWRWLFGVPLLLVLWGQGRAALGAATGGSFDPSVLGLDAALLRDPVGALSADPLRASAKFAGALGAVLPGLEHAALVWGPVLFVAWVVLSSLGRTLVLRRADARLASRPGTLMVLGALRAALLVAVLGVWVWGLRWSAGVAIAEPAAAGQEPNLVLYFALAIVWSLGLFTAWAAAGWVLGIAPLLAMLRGLGPGGALRAALRLGPVKGKLVEINLVLGIVKIALVVLAMVFSATPLPFQDVATPGFLAWWWAGVTVLYLLWSDFFHVARLLGYLELWRAYEAGDDA